MDLCIRKGIKALPKLVNKEGLIHGTLSWDIFFPKTRTPFVFPLSETNPFQINGTTIHQRYYIIPQHKNTNSLIQKHHFLESPKKQHSICLQFCPFHYRIVLNPINQHSTFFTITIEKKTCCQIICQKVNQTQVTKNTTPKQYQRQ